MFRSTHDYIKYSIWCKKQYEEILEENIKNSEVVIVGLSICPWTMRAKTLIKEFYSKESTMIAGDVLGNDYKVDLLYCMCKKANTTNVPQIWIKGKHIGGFEQLWKMHHRGQINL